MSFNRTRIQVSHLLPAADSRRRSLRWEGDSRLKMNHVSKGIESGLKWAE